MRADAAALANDRRVKTVHILPKPLFHSILAHINVERRFELKNKKERRSFAPQQQPPPLASSTIVATYSRPKRRNFARISAHARHPCAKPKRFDRSINLNAGQPSAVEEAPFGRRHEKCRIIGDRPHIFVRIHAAKNLLQYTHIIGLKQRAVRADKPRLVARRIAADRQPNRECIAAG